jgi:hypothetical protein
MLTRPLKSRKIDLLREEAPHHGKHGLVPVSDLRAETSAVVPDLNRSPLFNRKSRHFIRAIKAMSRASTTTYHL